MAGSLSVRYSAPALIEIDEIYNYIAKDNPLAAADVLAAIRESVDLLSRYPRKSRRTPRRGMRALPLSQYPYIIFFRLRRGELEVLHVLHGARRHPGFQETQHEFARSVG
jgi:plasmid stabilization system protein ParE